MANEITGNASLAYSDSEGTDETLAIEDFQLTVATKRITRNKMAVTTAEVAIPLGNLTALGYAIFVNRDVTNFIEIRVGTGSTKFAKLKPNNGFAILHLGSGVTAPYAIADTATCQMEYFIVST